VVNNAAILVGLHRVIIPTLHAVDCNRVLILHTYLLCGATVLVELWLTHILYVRFRDSKFLQRGVVSPTLNLEDQGISLSLTPPSNTVRHEWPYQQLCCCRYSFRVQPLTQQHSASDKVEIP
jgi:hypothetical protein